MLSRNNLGLGLLLGLLHSLMAAQSCPDLTFPRDGDTDVPVDATIRWESPGPVTGFIVSIGTQPNGVDILQNRTSSPITEYTPETGLPEDTWIYVSIRLELADGSVVNCPGQRFRTAPFDAPPDCTRLTEPLDGATDYPVNETINWEYAPTATGYEISIGTSPGGTDLADGLDVGNQLSYNPIGSLPTDTDIYVTIVPYNRLGPAPGPCREERFTTGASLIDCGPQRPVLSEAPAVFGLCPLVGTITLESEVLADGYDWYRVGTGDTETLVGTGPLLEVDQVGTYRLEAYNRVGSIQEFTRCSSYRDYEVILSEPPLIGNVSGIRESDGLTVRVEMASSGSYEFALLPEGPYQDAPVFSGLEVRPYTVYVRERSGCGTDSRKVNRNLSAADFPAFFTPNSDGFNDFWRFVAPEDLSNAEMERIRIFDRYGNFLIQLDRGSRGWDGNVQGRPLPASVYWFEAVSLNRQVIRGYFALKR